MKSEVAIKPLLHNDEQHKKPLFTEMWAKRHRCQAVKNQAQLFAEAIFFATLHFSES